jgi:hypothetical protein
MAESTKTETIMTNTGVEIDESRLPPLPPLALAAYRRMWREPQLFDAYQEGDWLAFSGEEIVAAAPSLDELYRILDDMGEQDVFVVPATPAHF